MRVRPFERLPAAQALAAEAAALDALAAGGPEALHLWEASGYAAVLPRSGSDASHLLRPESPGVEVIRRTSGGGSVVVGPGCLCYGLVLSLDRRPELLDVPRSYQTLLGALAAELPGVTVAGSDLLAGDRKVAGHAQRRTRHGLLHHGAILHDFDLPLITRTLREPRRRPAHRGPRTHDDFLANAPATREDLVAALETALTTMLKRDL